MFKLSFLKAKYLKPRFLMVIFLVVVLGFLVAGAANAGISDAVATFMGWIVYGIVWALGHLLTLMMNVLVWIAQWSNFINAPAVVSGWKIVRDICNMFFVVIMLIIAFATILRVKDYTYEKLLPKLIIMAILINFSKMICGLLTDVSQVVMLTFVNSFKDVGGTNLTNILGLDTLMAIDGKGGDSEADNITAWSIMGSYVLALVYVIIALITIVTMVVMLAVRIVMIWIYVVLSPLAYLLGAFPAGKKYASEWWKEFTKNLIVGPVLAFFIWLSFAALGTQDAVSSSGIKTDTPTDSEFSQGGSSALTEAGSPDNMLNFVISIAMLYGGLTVAKSIGGAAGGMAGKGMNAISKGVVKPVAAGAAGAYAFSKRKAIAGGKNIARGTGAVLGGVDRLAGSSVNALTNKIRTSQGKEALKTNHLGETGLARFVTKGTLSLPKKLSEKAKNSMAGDREINANLRNFNEEERVKGKDAEYKHHLDGQKYKWDKKEKEFYRYNENNERIVAFDKNGEKVRKMNLIEQVTRDSIKGNFDKSTTASNLAQEKKIAERQKAFADSGKSNEELSRLLHNASTSLTDKMAISMTLASKGGFGNNEEVKKAKDITQGNPFINKKIDEEVDKNQTHLNYDFSLDEKGNYTNQGSVDRFKKRMSTGKINSTAVPSELFEQAGAIKALDEYHGKDFDRYITSMYNRGSKFEKTVDGGLLASRKFGVDSKGKPAIDKEDKFASLHAKLTGNIAQSFQVDIKKPDGTTESNFDSGALGEFVKKNKAADLNNIDLSGIGSNLKKDLGKDPAKDEEIKKQIEDLKNNVLETITKNITSAKLTAMNKNGSNEELVKKLVNLQAEKGSSAGSTDEEKDKKEYIWNSRELSSLLDDKNAAIMKKILADRKKEEAKEKEKKENKG